jgi:hypothetical protein
MPRHAAGKSAARGRKKAMNDEPVRPLHVHEPLPVERRWLNSAGYLAALAAVALLVAAVLFGLR